jgi:hypothetical protein
MNANHEFDRIAQAWLAEGPEQLPDRVLDAVVEEIHQTRQGHARRVPWRDLRMNHVSRALAGIAAIAVVLVGGTILLRSGTSPGPIGGPSPSPSSPAPSASTAAILPPVVPSSVLVNFSSAAYGYSIDYPSNWKSRSSNRQILVHEYPYAPSGQSGSAVDLFSATATGDTDPVLVVAAPIVDSGMTLVAWVAVIEKLQIDDSCPPPEASEDVQVGGEPGRLLTWNCPFFVYWVAVEHGTRAYHVIWIDQKALGSPAIQATDKALFEKILATLTFTSAVDASPSPATSQVPQLSQTFTSPGYGFSVRYPDRWTAHPATDRWVSGAKINWGGGIVDDLHGADVRFSGASQLLKSGETPAGRLQTMIDASLVCPPKRPTPDKVPVGDQIGTVAVNGCSTATPAFGGAISPSGYVYEVFTMVGNRVYDFILDGAVDPTYLQAMLATVTFDPASAVDPSASP